MARSARKLETPLRCGDVVPARVEALPLGPDAVLRSESGYVLFAPGGIPGETVRVRVTEAKRRFGRAEIVSVEAASGDRAEPFCRHFLRCGGCHLQHVAAAARRRAKGKLLASALERALGRAVNVAPPEPAPERGYRNKVALVLSPSGPRGIAAGFYRAHSHEIVPIEECPVQDSRATALAFAAVDALRAAGVRAFDEDRGTGDARYVVVRAGAGTGELYLVIVVAKTGRPSWIDALLARLEGLAPAPVGIALNVSPKRERDLVFGDETHVLRGRPRFRTTIEGISYEVGPGSFFQTSEHGAAAVVRAVLRLLGDPRGRRALDVYGGVGLIGLQLARRGARVVVVEGSGESLACARASALATGLDVALRKGRAEDVLPRLAREGGRADLAVLDPPREGCHPRVLSTVARELDCRCIAYVSCEPTSLARDLAALEGLGFATREVVAIDMFPHSYHVEGVALVERRP